MSSNSDDKRMTDAELEAVSGGVAPALSPAAVQALVGAAVANGGAYALTTTAPTATVASHEPGISADQLFGSSLAVSPPPSSETVSTVTGHVTLSGSLALNVPQLPDDTITVMTFNTTSGGFTEVTPMVVGTQSGSPDYVGQAAYHEGVYMSPED